MSMTDIAIKVRMAVEMPHVCRVCLALGYANYTGVLRLVAENEKEISKRRESRGKRRERIHTRRHKIIVRVGISTISTCDIFAK